MSIYSGIDDIIDEHFGCTDIGTTAPHYRHVASGRRLSRNPPANPDIAGLLDRMLAKLRDNWEKSGSRAPSSQNWRWEKVTYIAENNPSKEKCLEKAIAKYADAWTNQVPVASGLHSGIHDRHRNVDLICQLGFGHYQFVELKVGSNTPLMAAVEILQYVVFYVFALQQYDVSAPRVPIPLLEANRIELRVAAPEAFYTKYDSNLNWLVAAINEGLASWQAIVQVKLDIDFDFLSFPYPDANNPPTNSQDCFDLIVKWVPFRWAESPSVQASSLLPQFPAVPTVTGNRTCERCKQRPATEARLDTWTAHSGNLRYYHLCDECSRTFVT